MIEEIIRDFFPLLLQQSPDYPQLKWEEKKNEMCLFFQVLLKQKNNTGKSRRHSEKNLDFKIVFSYIQLPEVSGLSFLTSSKSPGI